MSKQEKASWPALGAPLEGETPGARSSSWPLGWRGETNLRPSSHPPDEGYEGGRPSGMSAVPWVDATARLGSQPPGWSGEGIRAGGQAVASAGARGRAGESTEAWGQAAMNIGGGQAAMNIGAGGQAAASAGAWGQTVEGTGAWGQIGAGTEAGRAGSGADLQGQAAASAEANGQAARASPKRLWMLGAGLLLALAGPPFGFYLTRAVLALPYRGEPFARSLTALSQARPLLTPGLVAFALLVASAVVATGTMTLAAFLRRARPANEPGYASEVLAETSGNLGTAEIVVAESVVGNAPDYLLNQQEAFHYVDSIDDRAERALIEAALAHAITFLLVDDRYASEFKTNPMNLLTYARAVHAFAKNRLTPELARVRESVPAPTPAEGRRAPW